MSCGAGRRRGLDPALLWLEATAPIKTPSLETSVCRGCGPKKQKKNKTKNKKKKTKNKKKGGTTRASVLERGQ